MPAPNFLLLQAQEAERHLGGEQYLSQPNSDRFPANRLTHEKHSC